LFANPATNEQVYRSQAGTKIAFYCNGHILFDSVYRNPNNTQSTIPCPGGLTNDP